MQQKWKSSKRTKPKLGSEIVVAYGNGKKEIVFCDAKMTAAMRATNNEFKWIELPPNTKYAER